VRASLAAVDEYGLYLGIGLSMFVGIQALTNLAVVLGLLPTKGLTLPFLSFGGSSLLVNCAAVGILLNVSRPRRALDPEGARAAEKTASGEKNRRRLVRTPIDERGVPGRSGHPTRIDATRGDVLVAAEGGLP
jgi:hypothetical protein